ncbi:hypothetical protein B296_00011083 [Ensete ventricosum]|uniref:Serine-threonine/tyrosine-protein kinase catalytic domain-containing protein n=1 Tax=Ensete ventricosum TaxID=4639 RepID=A0A426Z4F4_ENSVE|nr:hypothetical protein B296_00011083 [Ensete ventricosum]
MSRRESAHLFRCEASYHRKWKSESQDRGGGEEEAGTDKKGRQLSHFGVVLLELITGRRPVGEFGDGVDIVQWAKRVTDCSRDNVAAIADPRLSTVPIAEAMHVFFVAMLCVQENSVERPTMREVVQMLSEFPHHVPETHSPSSSAAALKESSSGKKETGFCKLFPDLLN